MESSALNTLQQNGSAECFRGVVILKEELNKKLKEEPNKTLKEEITEILDKDKT